MSKLKDFVITFKNYIIAAVCIILALILIAVSMHMENSLSAQTIADRWDDETQYTEVSVFFSREAGFNRNSLGGVRNTVRQKVDESVALDDVNGRYFIDTYSTQTTLQIYNKAKSVEARAFGVGGDFFLFHPIELVDGNYFDELTDPNEDGIILDENLAWQLFGAIDVAGMNVTIGDRTYLVRGVVKQEDGMFSEAINETVATVYMQYSALEREAGQEAQLNLDSYEALIIDPVKEFALNAVTEGVKTTVGVDEKNFHIIENSKRFTVAYKLKHLKTLFLDSMNLKGIILPYWENKARGVEQITLLLFVLTVLLLVYPVVYLGYKLIKLIRYLWGRFVTPILNRGK
ncbi:MAG: ABC transporter permease, partial [Parasporobacterium sp.]|nr:ABC transporter permease [Parasporobacterium sp.]